MSDSMNVMMNCLTNIPSSKVGDRTASVAEARGTLVSAAAPPDSHAAESFASIQLLRGVGQTQTCKDQVNISSPSSFMGLPSVTCFSLPQHSSSKLTQQPAVQTYENRVYDHILKCNYCIPLNLFAVCIVIDIKWNK